MHSRHTGRPCNTITLCDNITHTIGRISTLILSTIGKALTPSDTSTDKSRQDIPRATSFDVGAAPLGMFWRISARNLVRGAVLALFVYLFIYSFPSYLLSSPSFSLSFLSIDVTQIRGHKASRLFSLLPTTVLAQAGIVIARKAFGRFFPSSTRVEFCVAVVVCK